MTTKALYWRFEMRLHDEKGKVYQLGAVLGKGGEAEVWTVRRRSELVAKIYRKPSIEREKKLRVMVAEPPVDPIRTGRHVSICWPRSILFDDHNRIVGFLMPRIDMKRHRELFRICNPSTRRVEAPEFSWAYLVAAAENISIVVDSIHTAGYVVGDMNESNFFISSNARASIVDCDSMQVSTSSNVYRCTVAKAEYLAPELHHADLCSCIRTKAEDNFALAVLIFLLLMEGVHPFAGKWQGQGAPPPLDERIASGDTPYGGSARILPSPIAPPISILPVNVQQLFLRAFLHGNRDPLGRPSASEWQQCLHTLGASMSTCASNPRHRYSNHLPRCPWCERVLLCGFDPYPSSADRQRSHVQSPARPAALRQEVVTSRSVKWSIHSGMDFRQLLQNRIVLSALIFIVPLLSALLAALLVRFGGLNFTSFPRNTVMLTALLAFARCIQIRRYRSATFSLAGGALAYIVFTALSSRGPLSYPVAYAILEAMFAFFASRLLLRMLRSTLDRYRATARTTAIATLLGLSLVQCPAVGLCGALASLVAYSKGSTTVHAASSMR